MVRFFLTFRSIRVNIIEFHVVNITSDAGDMVFTFVGFHHEIAGFGGVGVAEETI